MERADSYFCVNKSQKKGSWVSICKEYESKLIALRDQTDTNNFFEQLFAILNARDFVYKQMLRSVMYRKEMLWMDIGIDTSQFVHDESKKLQELIKEKQDELGYAPTLIEFVPPSFEEVGAWSLSQKAGKSSEPNLVTMMSLLNNDLKEVG